MTAWTRPIIEELSLRDGTLQYKMWTQPPVPMYLKFYLFNVTNSRDVVENNSKPILQQLGPYTFRETHVRVNVQRHDNFTLTFQQRRVWHFEEALSNGTLQDSITTLNVPLVGAVYTLRYQPLWFKVVFNRIVKMLKSRLFVTKSAIELLFDGYSDPLLDLGQRLPPGTFPPFDKFAWFYQRNNSDYYDGIFNVYTGEDHIGKFGEMASWNYTKQTNYYDSYCGMVNGSFGEGWAPRRNRSSISLYVTDICRTVTLDYESDVVNRGVASYRFVGTERVFSNKTVDAENWCFCPDGVCIPSGVGNASSCRFGAPVFVSFPHYYLADPYYIDQVEGLSPDKELHEFHVDLEPDMAVPTAVRARLQVNILIEPDIDIDVVSSAKRTYVPLVWFEISADLTDDLSWWINLASHMPVIGTASLFGIFCASLVAMAISGVIVIKRRSRTHPITAKEDAVRG